MTAFTSSPATFAAATEDTIGTKRFVDAFPSQRSRAARKYRPLLVSEPLAPRILSHVVGILAKPANSHTVHFASHHSPDLPSILRPRCFSPHNCLHTLLAMNAAALHGCLTAKSRPIGAPLCEFRAQQRMHCTLADIMPSMIEHGDLGSICTRLIRNQTSTRLAPMLEVQELQKSTRPSSASAIAHHHVANLADPSTPVLMPVGTFVDRAKLGLTLGAFASGRRHHEYHGGLATCRRIPTWVGKQLT